ncbi:MAG: MFS transporter [Desulfobacteraceae bacterium]|nr:MFS transporter [Desulfobacteraceae bacterium]
MTADNDRKWKIFFLVATSIFMSTLDSSIVNIALPFMMQDLQTDIRTIQWVVLVYLVTVSSLLLTFGRLSDIKGRRLVYCAGFGLFSAGSLFCALAQGSDVLIVSRAVQGCGASMLMACSPAIVVDVFPEQERGKALGMMGAVVAAGLTTGPVAGGIILEYFSWRAIFYINIPIGIAATFAGLSILKHTTAVQGSEEPMDKIGSIFLIILLTSLILFMTHITQWGIYSVKSGMCLLTGITSGILFIANEAKSKYPLFDLGLLKIRLFVLPVLASAILFAALFIIVFTMPFYLTYPCQLSASNTGMIMIVPFLFLLFVSPMAGTLYHRFGSRRLCVIGMLVLALSLLSLMSLTPDEPVIAVLWRIALAGVGTALFVSPNNTAIMSCVPKPRRGIASGSVATARNVGMVFGVALAGLVFSNSFSNFTQGATLENYTLEMAPFFVESFHRTMAAGAIVCAIGIIVTIGRGKEALPFDTNEKEN